MRYQTDIRAVILALLAQGPKHGYGLAKAAREGSEGALKLGEGQLYPALYAMEELGWISAEWEDAGGEQQRRVYRITEAGSAELEARAARWHAFASGVANILPSAGHFRAEPQS